MQLGFLGFICVYGWGLDQSSCTGRHLYTSPDVGQKRSGNPLQKNIKNAVPLLDTENRLRVASLEAGGGWVENVKKINKFK